MNASSSAPVGRSQIEAIADRYYLVLAPEISAAEYGSLLAELRKLGLVPARKGPYAGEDGADNIEKQAGPATKSKAGAESGSHPEPVPAPPPRTLLLESRDRIALDEVRDRLKELPAGAGVRYLNPVYRLKTSTTSARRTYGGQIIIRVPPSDLASLADTLEAVASGATVKELADLLPPFADHRLLTLLDDLAIFKVIDLPAMVDALDVAEELNQRLRVSTAAPDWIHMDVRATANGGRVTGASGTWGSPKGPRDVR